MENHETLQVCTRNENATPQPCGCAVMLQPKLRCGQHFVPKSKRHRFASKECRNRCFREPQRAKRRRWTEARMRDKSFAFDGRLGGPSIDFVVPLAEFEKGSKT